MQIKLAFTRKVLHLASCWKWEFLELGNDPLFYFFLLMLVQAACLPHVKNQESWRFKKCQRSGHRLINWRHFVCFTCHTESTSVALFLKICREISYGHRELMGERHANQLEIYPNLRKYAADAKTCSGKLANRHNLWEANFKLAYTYNPVWICHLLGLLKRKKANLKILHPLNHFFSQFLNINCEVIGEHSR